jgi:hypothetical protein
MMNTVPADLIDPETGEILGQLSLVGEPFLGSPFAGARGRLQNFVILTEKKEIWEAWFNQQELLMQTDQMQWLVRIVTHPTEGENQGMLSYTRTIGKVNRLTRVPPDGTQNRKWLNLIQVLLGS